MNPYYQPPGEWKSEEPKPPPEDSRPLRHNWFYYVGGFFIIVAAICFVLSNSLVLRAPAPPAPKSASGK